MTPHSTTSKPSFINFSPPYHHIQLTEVYMHFVISCLIAQSVIWRFCNFKTTVDKSNASLVKLSSAKVYHCPSIYVSDSWTSSTYFKLHMAISDFA